MKSTSRSILFISIALTNYPIADAQTITAPNNQGIITQGQTGNNFIGKLPRTLLPEQKEGLLLSLSKSRATAINFAPNDSDSANLAASIRDFLIESGYKIAWFHTSFEIQADGTTPKGITVRPNIAHQEQPQGVYVGVQE